MVQDPAAGDPLGHAGDLFPLHQDVVPAAELSPDAHGGQGPAHRLGKVPDAQLLRVPHVADQGVVEIAQVVVRTTVTPCS